MTDQKYPPSSTIECRKCGVVGGVHLKSAALWECKLCGTDNTMHYARICSGMGDAG